MKSSLVCLLSLGGLLLSAATPNSKLILFGLDGNPAVEVVAMPPSNGPTLAQQGVIGRLVYLESDVTGCSGLVSTMNAVAETATMAASGLRSIVLMERSSNDDNKCTFEEKIEAVQKAGAAAAIIFDNVEEGPITMVFGNEADITIPSAFISYDAGMTLLELLQDNVQPLTLLQPEPELNWRVALAMFEMISISSGYMIFFILAFPVSVWNTINLIRKSRIHNAIYEVVTKDPSLKSTVESRVDSRVLPLDSFEHPANSYCKAISKFLSLTIVIFLLESVLFEMVVDKDNRGKENPTFDASKDDAVNFGVHIMMDSLYISLCLCLLAFSFKKIFKLICVGDIHDSDDVDVDSESKAIDRDIEKNECGKSYELISQNDNSRPLLSVESQPSEVPPSAPELSQVSSYEPPPSPASFLVPTTSENKTFLLLQESKSTKAYKL